jgi:hypothetical protein
MGGGTDALLGEAVEDVDQLSQLPTLLGFTLCDAIGYARLDVELEDREADSIERGLGCRKLLQDFHACSRLLHHATDAANLSLDSVQAGDEGLLLGGVQHGPHHTSGPKAHCARVRRAHVQGHCLFRRIWDEVTSGRVEVTSGFQGGRLFVRPIIRVLV